MNFDNPIWIASHIDDKDFYIRFTSRFSELMKITKRGDEITVYINSPGGHTRTALGIYDLFANCGRTVIGVVTGRADSAASIILQACSRRIMTRHSTLMLHRTSIGMTNMPIHAARAAMESFLQEERDIHQIYCMRSGRDINSPGDDVYFTAERAHAAGLIDEIYG